MKIDEIRTQDEKELALHLREKRARIFDLRFKAASEGMSDTKELQRLRRDIARILTIQNDRKRKEKAGDGR
jgi:large subunit ribosomal protein L29